MKNNDEEIVTTWVTFPISQHSQISKIPNFIHVWQYIPNCPETNIFPLEWGKIELNDKKSVIRFLGLPS